MNTVESLAAKNLAHPPGFLPKAIQYEVITGSFAYGVSSDTSDVDLIGFAIPDKDMVFPHLRGEIDGFGRNKQRFEQYQEHHIKDVDALGGGKGREYDITVYSIVKFFMLCMECNPNMIDTLFVPQRCILTMTPVGNIVRENRKLFLHKGAWHKFKGYAYSQVHKMATKNPTGKRSDMIEKFGLDVKFAYHVVRLLNEIEMILTEGDLDLERNNEQLKAIRRGEWTEQQIIEYFNAKERDLEALYTSSKLPHSPDEERIKGLLLDCLEQHFTTLSGAVVRQDKAALAIAQIKEIIQRAGL